MLSILCALTLSAYSQNIFNKKNQKDRINYESLTDSSGENFGDEKTYFQLKYYEAKLFTGIAYQEDYAGKLKGEYNYKHGVLNGETKVWSENGQLISEWNFIDGETNGEVKEWYANGRLKRTGNIKMVNGEIVSGQGKTLYESGQLKQEKRWENRELIYEKCFNLVGIEVDCHTVNEVSVEEVSESYEEENISYPLVNSQDSENIHILEIERNADNYFDNTTVTKIHFIYTCSDLYSNGGWFNINENIKIKDSYGDRQYSLLKSIGVPLSPEMKDCDFQNQIHSFILIFEVIDSDITMIDILECEDTCFNFYGVNLEYTEEQ